MNVVGECTVQVAFYRFFIIVGQCEVARGQKVRIEVWMRSEIEIAASIVEPCSTTPSRRKPFENESLCFWGARWKDPGLVRREVAFAHIGLPFPGSSLLAVEILAAPCVIADKCYVVASLEKAVLVP